jgi:hypothetical protein
LKENYILILLLEVFTISLHYLMHPANYLFAAGVRVATSIAAL